MRGLKSSSKMQEESISLPSHPHTPRRLLKCAFQNWYALIICISLLLSWQPSTLWILACSLGSIFLWQLESFFCSGKDPFSSTQPLKTTKTTLAENCIRSEASCRNFQLCNKRLWLLKWSNITIWNRFIRAPSQAPAGHPQKTMDCLTVTAGPPVTRAAKRS